MRNAWIPLWTAAVTLAISFGTAGCGGGSASATDTRAILTGRAYSSTVGGAVTHPETDVLIPNVAISFHAPGSTTELARAVTDASGNYSVRLSAGTYAADIENRDNGPAYNTVTPQKIVVSASGSSQQDLKFVLLAP